MSLVVQKFGGTSVADCQMISAAARKAIRAQQEGHQVVVVVSAMGKNTDLLVDLSGQLSDDPPAREMDMLLSTGEQVSVALMAIAIHSLGSKGVSLTGSQIGIRTDSIYTKARIKSISTDRINSLLEQGNIVIAAGFQGMDENFNITTLGRGGSDTTAVALAAVLGGSTCEIYTDVDGVYTTDPRVLPEARRVSQISYDEMLELASLGAGVMHSRAVEFGKKFNVPIHVRSSFSDTPGTMIVPDPEDPTAPVCGCAMTKTEARVTILGVPDRPGVSLEIFSAIADCNVSVDMIVQNVGHDGHANISFTVQEKELAVTLGAVQSSVAKLGEGTIVHDSHVSKVSVVGLGMAHQTGVADRMFRALADANVNIQMITTSEIKISVLVDRNDSLKALRAVHAAFELEKPPAQPPVILSSEEMDKSAFARDAAEVASRLAHMEELTIDEVSCDETQARVTIDGIPDTPGVAARVFKEVADADVMVDMIVQSIDEHAETTSLSFTVPRTQLQVAETVAERLSQHYSCERVTSSPEVAKLSVSGIGLRSHTEVAIRMFEALSGAGINLGMINTSEVRVNVVVDGKQGMLGLERLRAAFADVTA